MSIAQTKENIIILLENIIKRSENLEKQKGSKSLMEIDLAMEDIRLLYREMDRLRKFTEMEAVNAPLEIKERNMAGLRNEMNAPSPQSEVAHRQVDTPQEPVRGEEEKEEAETPAGKASEPHVSDEQPKTEETPVSPPLSEPEAPVESEKKDEVPAPPAEEEKPRIDEAPSRAQHEKESATGPGNNTSEQNENKEPAADPVMHNSQRKASAPAKPISDILDKQKPVVGETFTNNKSSVHERLAHIKDDKSIGTRMQYKPVTNIKEAIGINEKFLFINELFSGDLNAYNDAVNQLNSCPSIHEAFELLNKLTIEFQWDGQRSAETIEKFANLVQRRYM